jgi:3-hydroxyisobutyrate dehydrogenase
VSGANAIKAGVIGLGQMGGGIARNIAAKSSHLAAVWDVAPDAAERAPQGVPLMNPREMASVCDAIIMVVPSSKEIELCLTGPDGILVVDRPGQVLFDLTSSHPEPTKRLAALAAERGRSYVDAGMTGGAIGADAGKLTLMMGGNGEDIERCAPVLELFAPKRFRMGEVGAGHTMKLIHNMILHTNFFVTSEGCRVAEKAGLDLAQVVDVLNAGFARSVITEFRFPSNILSGKWNARSVVSNLAKDLGLAAKMAADMGQPAPYGTMTAELLQEAMGRGMENTDFSRLYLEMDDLLAKKAPGKAQG